MSEVVRTSSKVNVPQLCGNEQGDVFVPVYDFVVFLARYFKRFDKIKQFQIIPPGLSPENQWYLHDEIMEFVLEQCQV